MIIDAEKWRQEFKVDELVRYVLGTIHVLFQETKTLGAHLRELDPYQEFQLPRSRRGRQVLSSILS
jgi:hypothetical protein